MNLFMIGWYCIVAPFAGAWIEIRIIHELCLEDKVAPFAGAWIEMIPS